jgi:carbon storage regulator CsrA
MLVLARHENETVMIDGGIEITVVEIGRGRVKLGFTAPKDTTILRKELCGQTGNELSIRTKHQGKTVRTVPSGIYD